MNYADLEIHQGADIVFRLELVNDDKTAKDLTNLTARAYIKKTYATSDSDAITFECSFPEPRTDGYLDLTLDGTVSDDMRKGMYYYDVFLFNNDSDSEKILEGRVDLKPSATSII